MNWMHYDVFVAHVSISEWEKVVYSSLISVLGLRVLIQKQCLCGCKVLQ